MTFLPLVSGLLVGLVAPIVYMLAIRLHRCRCCICLGGHGWERLEIHGAHYRESAIETFRVCRRCGQRERIEPSPPFDNIELSTFSLVDLEMMSAEAAMADKNSLPSARPKPRPTHTPSDGMRVSKMTARPLPRPGPGRKVLS